MKKTFLATFVCFAAVLAFSATAHTAHAYTASQIGDNTQADVTCGADDAGAAPTNSYPGTYGTTQGYSYPSNPPPGFWDAPTHFCYSIIDRERYLSCTGLHCGLDSGNIHRETWSQYANTYSGGKPATPQPSDCSGGALPGAIICGYSEEWFSILPPPPPLDTNPSVTLTATPPSITKGASSLLTWSSKNAASCTSPDFDTGGAVSGSVPVSPAGTTTYHITCSASGGGSAGTTTSVTPIEHDAAACTGTDTGYASPEDNSGYGPGIITNHYIASPGDAYPYAPPGFQTNPQNYCVTLAQATDICKTSTCTPNSYWSYTWYLGTGIGGYQTEDATHKYKDESWTFQQAPTATGTTAPSGNSASAQATVSVTASSAAPTATLVANPSAINSGQSSTLTWGSTNATSCAGSGFSTGGATSGSASVSPSKTSSYSVTCTGAGGSAMATAWVQVSSGGCSGPDCFIPPGSGGGGGGGGGAGGGGGGGGSASSLSALLLADPISIVRGFPAHLTWASKNAASCAGDNFSTKGATAGETNVSPAATTLYTLTCEDAAGNQAFDSQTVTVTSPVLSISASPELVRPGDSSVVSWGVVGKVTSCAVSGPGLSSTALSGSSRQVISKESTYTLSCKAGAFHPSSSVTIKLVPSFKEF